MPRTWSYRKRDYQLVKPQVQGISPQIVGLIIVYVLIASAITIGMTFAFVHQINQTTPITSLPPGQHREAVND